MHPWFKKGEKRMVPDVGRFMYKHVHSLHHKSYNPTAFSGTSMHPIEYVTPRGPSPPRTSFAKCIAAVTLACA
jgi:hypothetical protein